MVNSRKIIKAVYISFISFMLLNFIGAGILYTGIKTAKEKQYYQAIDHTQKITANLEKVLTHLHTITALLRYTNGSLEAFEETAPYLYQLIEKETGVHLKNLACAPDGVVQKVYPLEGNEALIGFDFMDGSQPGNTEAIEAYLNGNTVITNPFPLIQGGLGMAGRTPVNVNVDGEKKLWGLITITMDYKQLLSTFGLDNLDKQNLEWQLWYTEKDGNKTNLASSRILPKNPVNIKFDIFNLEWNLEVKPRGGWIKPYIIVISEIAMSAIAAVIAFIYYTQSLLKATNNHLEFIAERDALTHTYSRHYVNTRLINQRNGHWAEPNVKYSMAIVDVDRFKQINDSFGHDLGDRALVAITQVLSSHIREEYGDRIIRFGGDEFIVLWNDVTRERLETKLNNIIAEVSEIVFPDATELKLGVSIGAALYESDEESLYYMMVKKADSKLYEAKESGKNCYMI